MKNVRVYEFKYLFIALAASLVMASGIPFVASLQAQSTEEKISILSSALRARDSGNLEEAKRLLEQLNRMSPNDVNIHRLLAGVNKELEKRPKASVASTSISTYEPAPVVTSSSTSYSYQEPAAPEPKKKRFSWFLPKKSKEEAAVEALVDTSSQVESTPSVDDMLSGVGDDGSAQAIDLDALISAAEEESGDQIDGWEDNLGAAEELAEGGNYDEAESLIDDTLEESAEAGEEAESLREDLTSLKNGLNLMRAEDALAGGDIEAARAFVRDYEFGVGGRDEVSKKAYADITAHVRDPERLDIRNISPEFVQRGQELDEQIAIGRAQFNHGDYDGALDTFARVEASDPSNTEAKYFQSRIAEIKGHRASLNHLQTRNTFLQNVREAWALPKIFDREGTVVEAEETGPIEKKLRDITIPEVNFRGLALSRVIETLHAYSVVHDPDGEGVNIIPMNPDGADPTVNITLRGLSLGRVLDFVVQAVGYDYDIKEDSVIVTPGDGPGTSQLETEFFAISRAAIIRMTNEPDDFGGGDTSSSPFDDPSPADTGGGSNKEEALIDFFERAGVSFAQVPGAKLALTDAQIIVTQTSRNLKKIGNILKKFSEIKMVEIEAKFLEVQQGDLEEFGVNWNIAGGEYTFASQNRTVASAFAPSVDNNNIVVTTSAQPAVFDLLGQPVSPGIPGTETLIPSNAPPVPGQINTGPTQGREVTFGDGETRALGPADVGIFSGQIGKYEVQAIIRALSQKTGNDLMTAPKVTVLSKKTAEIVVAQELIYPESYGDIEAEVSRGGRSSGDIIGSASSSIAITAGTPQDFTMRNVGVEMEVTPTVEEDYSISMLLEPKVTEFDGFVEYGGPSVAISGTITVTVPSGFYQPIFSVRRVRTEVTIWDGATVLLGGLTREQIFTVNDKVPVLGDIPLVGRLFSHEGEGSQKRNLLIFVTANLISPGGSPARQSFRTVSAGTIYTNASIVTPGGIVTRSSADIRKE